jgi:hypothetical protein
VCNCENCEAEGVVMVFGFGFGVGVGSVRCGGDVGQCRRWAGLG